jgi:hypothetical protein
MGENPSKRSSSLLMNKLAGIQNPQWGVTVQNHKRERTARDLLLVLLNGSEVKPVDLNSPRHIQPSLTQRLRKN